MISYFPTPYPDELLYSCLSRYYVKSGHIAYTFAAQELFENRVDRPSVEFINRLTPNALSAITRNRSIEQVILEHTMFPYYGRFLPKQRRDDAYTAMASMNAAYRNYLVIPKRKGDEIRYLRYCPLCVKEDRKHYGEAYWHRTHQMLGLHICPVHKCYLHNSDMIIANKTSPTFYDADSNISNEKAVYCSDETECLLAEYMYAIFHSDIDMNNDVAIGKYLHLKLQGTKYLSLRGQQRNMTMLHADFVDYYKTLQEYRMTELWQIQKVMTGGSVNFYEVCMVGMFLNISPAELVNASLPEKTIAEEFDKQVIFLHNKGMNYMQIAEALGGSYDTVKAIGEKKYGTYHRRSGKGLKSGRKPTDWTEIDEKTLPLVAEAIRQLQGNGNTRPRKIAMATIERLLGLPSRRIELLPKCKALVAENMESQNEYWAKEVIWASNMILKEGRALTPKQIYNLTNMRPKNLKACLPYLLKYGDDDLVKKILSMNMA